MRYFKVFDDITPEGQMYRIDESGFMETKGGDGRGWHRSIYNNFHGQDALQVLTRDVQTVGGRIEDVEAGV
jgi:hypothetical protein